MFRKRKKDYREVTSVMASNVVTKQTNVFVLFIFILLMLPSISFATSAYLLSMQIQPSAQKSIISFSLNKKTKGKVKYLKQENQLIVEFENTLKRFDIHNAKLIGSNIERISSGVKGKSVFFYVTLNQKVKWSKSFLVNPDGRAVLRLEITSLSSSNKQTPIVTMKKARPFTVVIDAGHGGHDTGAIGPNGVREKNIVLAVSKNLAALINRQAGMRAILTRSSDKYVNLRQRLRLARKDDADLFIAIHADAHYNKNANGASVYALSQRGATTEAARWLAQKENYSEIGDVEFNALQDRSPLLRSVLIDMSQTVTHQDSERLGAKVLRSLDDVARLHYKKVERAPFVVLKSPDIPSILIETGFISNPNEERKLQEPAYQRALARAIFTGIQQYKKS